MSKKYQIIQSESRVNRKTSVQMKHAKVWNGISFVVLLLGLVLSQAGNAFAASQEETFIAARDAYRSGKIDRFNEYAQQLDGYVLQPYIAYWQSHMAEATPAEIRNFTTRYQDSPLADRLRKDWKGYGGNECGDERKLFHRGNSIRSNVLLSGKGEPSIQ